MQCVTCVQLPLHFAACTVQAGVMETKKASLWANSAASRNCFEPKLCLAAVGYVLISAVWARIAPKKRPTRNTISYHRGRPYSGPGVGSYDPANIIRETRPNDFWCEVMSGGWGGVWTLDSGVQRGGFAF
jgi:hypothetical protein